MILIATQCFPPRQGGIENVMSNLAAGFVSVGKSVTVFADQRSTINEGNEFDRAQPYHVLRFKGVKPWRRLLKLSAIKKYCQQHVIEAVITDSWKSCETVLPALKDSDIPLLCLAHGNDVLTHNNRKRKHRIQQAFNQASRVIAVSNATAELVRELNVKHLVVIHNGVPMPELIQRHQSSKPTLLTVSRLEPRKGQDNVIRVLPELIKIYPNIEYIIAGSGEYRPSLERLAMQLQVSKHVRFLGAVDDAQKKMLLARADLFVMPVRHDHDNHSVEGFGIALVEAQLARCPVLTGQVGGVIDVVQHSVTGFTCDGESPPDILQKIQMMLVQEKEVVSCVDNAYDYACKHFSIESMIRDYENNFTALSAT